MSSTGIAPRPAGARSLLERAHQAKRLVGMVAREPFQKRSWAELGFFLVSSVLACAATFALAAVAGAGVLLTVLIVGVLVLAGALRAVRGLGRWERLLARRMLGEDISGPEPFRARPGLLGWVRACFGDPAAWRAIAYLVAKLPLTVFGAWFAFSVWLGAIFGIASPLLGVHPAGRWGAFGRLFGTGSSGSGATAFVTGVIFLFIAPWTMRLVVYLDKAMMYLLLSQDAGASRVRSLEESRSKTLDAATETLRRIERDLHDGTQAQLVALAMRLGQAKDKLDHLGELEEDVELEAVRRLIDEAHRGAKEAITELRDLARGIHPPVLDTGLENALITLASRSPVPTELTVSVPSRASPALEAICYFCAAELLANVAQHAQASRASLSCVQHGPWLRVAVRDNGRGGAAVVRAGSSSSGLAGLADRVSAVDGYLSIASPRGGPSVIIVDVPVRT